ncbi:MAG: UDP-3-O-(3-hydroxymyristoyl)glucosamine N-acyltransferase [Synergistaceae bacterium]|jgi:UDP-3-O-[3-hydroxymyristoyl] glucosamine N-acyltransferase|nr:UDP-3-O-(3-hydroxymyristoyl)glucosamine N-acyltransferase [Synergistaceae bacterium]
MNQDLEIRLSELGEALGLVVVGDGTRVVRCVVPPEEGKPDALCVVWDEKALRLLDDDVPIVGKPEFMEGRLGLSAPDPRKSLPSLLRYFVAPVPDLKGIHPSAVVSSEAVVSEDAWVGPFCVVEPEAAIEAGARLISNIYVGANARIGSGTVVEPHVVLMAGTRIGKNGVLHAGCILGCDGFGFLPSPTGIVKIPQVGNVSVGDDVEIGACTAIDRGTIGDTVIGDGTKIDNHVQIGHNVRIGRNCIICSMSGIAGSTVVEDGVTVSAQVGVTDHVRIGKGATLGGRAGVTNDIPPGAIVSGFPARMHSEARRAQMLATRLPDLYERVRRLERVNGLGSLRKEKMEKAGKNGEKEGKVETKCGIVN